MATTSFRGLFCPFADSADDIVMQRKMAIIVVNKGVRMFLIWRSKKVIHCSEEKGFYCYNLADICTGRNQRGRET
jgi:hypothetical protein